MGVCSFEEFWFGKIDVFLIQTCQDAAPGMEIQAPGVAGEKEIQDLVGFLALHTVLDKDPHLPTWT